jgi:hypothetical protein
VAKVVANGFFDKEEIAEFPDDELETAGLEIRAYGAQAPDR